MAKLIKMGGIKTYINPFQIVFLEEVEKGFIKITMSDGSVERVFKDLEVVLKELEEAMK